MPRTAIILLLPLSLLTSIRPADAPPRTDLYGDPLPEGAIARFGTVRFRHANGAALAFTADGKRLISAATNKTIRFWDLESGKLLEEQKLPGHGSGSLTYFVALSPDGTLFAYQDLAVSFDVMIWDINRQVARRTQESDNGPAGANSFHHFIFTPDSKTLVTTRSNGEIRACDVETGQCRFIGGHRGVVQNANLIESLSFAADGTLVTMGNKNIHLWDVKAARELGRVTTAEMFAGGAVSPDGRIMAAFTFHGSDQDKGLQFLDSQTGEVVKDWIAPNFKQIGAVRFLPDGKSVAIGIKDRLVIWDPVAGKAIHTLPGGKGGAYNMAFSPDGKRLAAFDSYAQRDPRGAVVYVWDLATGAPHPANAMEIGHRGEVNSVALSHDGRIVASLSSIDGSLRLWDAATARQLRSIPVEGIVVHNVAFSPDGKQVFAMTWPAIIAWDVATGREVRRYAPADNTDRGPHFLLQMHLTTDGQKLIAISEISNDRPKHGLMAWDVATGKVLGNRTFTAEDIWISYGKFAPDGRLMVQPNGAVRDAITGEEWFRFVHRDNEELSFSVAVSRDGALAATAVAERRKRQDWEKRMTVQVSELSTRLPVRQIETGSLAHVAFTSGGRHLMTAGLDGLMLWDVASGKALASRPAPGSYRGLYGPSFASSFALAADGQTVVTGQPDTTVLLWDLPAPAPVRQNAQLSAEELVACWTDLAGDDAGRAAIAIGRLADAPEQALAMLRERLRAVDAPSAEELRRLLAGLDDDSFARREAAGKRLRELEELAEPALRKALEDRPSLELRRRIEPLLVEFRIVRSPESRRVLRSVRVLEAIGTAEARQLLKKLAQGAPQARGTQAAKEALERRSLK